MAPPFKQVKVRNANGREWWIPESDLPSVIKAGYEPVLEAEARPGLAFTAGVARAASFGATDYGMADLDPEAAGGIKALRETQAGPSLGGEVLGSLPTALAVPVGSIVKQGVLKTAGRVALESAALGSLQPAVTESVIEGKELTAESVARHAVGSALVGFGVGLGGASISKAFQKGSDAVANSALLSRAESMAENELRNGYLKGIINKAGDLKRHGLEERWDDIVKFGDREGIFQARDLEGVSNAADVVNQKYMREFGGLMESLDSASPVVRTAITDPDSGAVLGSHLAMELRNSAGYKAAKAVSDERVLPWEAAAKKLDDMLKTPDRTWSSVDAIAQEAGNHYVRVGGANGKTVTLVDEIRNIIGERVKKDLGLPDDTVDVLKRNLSDSMHLRDKAHDRFIESENQFANAAQLSVPGAVAFGARRAVKFASTVAGRSAIQSGGASMLAARALKSVGQNKVLTRGAAALRDTVMKTLDASVAVTAPWRIALERAASEGADEFLETHIQLATGPQGDEYRAAMNLPSGDVQGVGAKLATLGSIQDATDSIVDELAGSASGFVSGKGAGGKSVKPDFDSTVAALSKAMQSQESMFDRLPDHVKQHAPTTSLLATGKGIEALKFLDSKVPRGPYGPQTLAAMRPAYTPNAAEKSRFLRYVEAVSDPNGVFKAMAKGHVPAEHVEAMKAVYPETMARIGQALFTELAKLEKPLDYRRRITLANTFGYDAVGMSGGVAKVVQLSHGKAKEQQQSPQQQAPGGDGRQMVNTSKNLATQAQRMESR